MLASLRMLYVALAILLFQPTMVLSQTEELLAVDTVLSIALKIKALSQSPAVTTDDINKLRVEIAELQKQIADLDKKLDDILAKLAEIKDLVQRVPYEANKLQLMAVISETEQFLPLWLNEIQTHQKLSGIPRPEDTLERLRSVANVMIAAQTSYSYSYYQLVGLAMTHADALQELLKSKPEARSVFFANYLDYFQRATADVPPGQTNLVGFNKQAAAAAIQIVTEVDVLMIAQV